MKNLSISQIAQKVQKDWTKMPQSAAVYLNAMLTMTTIDENYGVDRGDMIVRYFLSNATYWRGETAKAVKAELKRRLK